MNESAAHDESALWLVTVFIALLCLTALTTAAHFVDLGAWHALVAMAIAACKASLVVLFFMHARRSQSLIWLVIATGLLWLALCIGLTLSDYATRHWYSADRNSTNTSFSR